MEDAEGTSTLVWGLGRLPGGGHIENVFFFFNVSLFNYDIN